MTKELNKFQFITHKVNSLLETYSSADPELNFTNTKDSVPSLLEQ